MKGPMSPIAETIWAEKYQLRNHDGTPVDTCVEDTWARVAKALAGAEAKDKRPGHEARFLDALRDYKFLPAGRILAGAGADRNVTLFNCFVMGVIPDDMAGIFRHLGEAALTMQAGGGIGYDFSPIRPAGSPVLGIGARASGPLSFMNVWDSMCATIMSAGHRRGAMMATLRCDHPDIEAFIEAKREPGRLRQFNLSVLVTDAFMSAVANADPWPLVFDGKVHRTIQAKELWDAIMRSTYDFAEPGVIFIDQVNQRNNLWYAESIYASNPCSEQMLPPYGACLLGSINLMAFIERPFEADAALNVDAFERTVATAIRMMDNVVDVSKFPLEAQREEALAKRRLGLGVTGLADALILCRLRYGSDEAVAQTRAWLARLERVAYATSVKLAMEKGAFPAFDAERYLAGETVRKLDADLQRAIEKHGIRNALLTSIAPTGTISLMADNVSSGIEPVFAFEFERQVRTADGATRTEAVSDPALRLFRGLNGATAPLPEYFVDAQSLEVDAHVAMQAAAQAHIDSAISKTINVPADYPFEAFKNVYRDAYDAGCKGCATYRPNDITGSVLTAPGAKQPAAPPAVRQDLHHRPEAIAGLTYKLQWPGSEHAIYVTLNDIVKDGRRTPYEIFINSKNMEDYASTVGLTRMISAVFRRGGDISFVAEELKAIFDPRGGHFMHGRYVPSLLAAIGNVIENHIAEVHPDAPPRDTPTNDSIVHRGRIVLHHTALCPRCQQPGLVHQEGCEFCPNCRFSKCQ